MSEPLDFTRPLWQIYLIEGLEGKRHAYVSKTHHALVDGVSALDVGTLLVDVSADGTEMPVPDAPWEPDEPSPRMLVDGRGDGAAGRAAARRTERDALGAHTHAGPRSACGAPPRASRRSRPAGRAPRRRS